MQSSLVLTLIGPDKPGIVDMVARVVAGHDGNWIESRLIRLAGQFAGAIRVDADTQRVDALTAALHELQSKGLTVTVQSADAVGVSEQPPDPRTLVLHFVGHDRPGLVRDIAAALASRSINVEELETAASSMPMTGEPMFTATALLRLPTGADEDELHAALDHLADQLGLDLHLDPPTV
jgi:glycine cleavage system regulatory protein